jgi:hypothetical protein
MSIANLPPILSREQLAVLLGISSETLLRWEGERRIPFCRLTQKVTVYVVEDVVQFIRTKTIPPTGAMSLPHRPQAQGPGRGVPSHGSTGRST